MQEFKRRFEVPELKIVMMEMQDIITTSLEEDDWDTGEY